MRLLYLMSMVYGIKCFNNFLTIVNLSRCREFYDYVLYNLARLVGGGTIFNNQRGLEQWRIALIALTRNLWRSADFI